MLSGLEIKRQVELGNIVISDFNEKQLNPNSYNIRLGKNLKVYEKGMISFDEIDKKISNNIEPIKDEINEKIACALLKEDIDDIANILDEQSKIYHRLLREYALDSKQDNETIDIEIPEEGYVLVPGILYLGETEEYTETYGFVPAIDGRSTTGRLGIEVHRTAGFGDNGFKGKWTLEITVTHPIIVYPGMEIGQLSYETIEGDSSITYDGKYQNQQGVEAAKVDKK